MALFCPGMLEELKKKIDIVDVLSPYMQFERSQGALKALCPFHFEHSPSFVVQRKDMHYHCFGCGAHGDAISFLMQHLRLSFQEAVQNLAERFGVETRFVEDVERGPSTLPLKQALKELNRFYHFCLLHTKEGQEALAYLYDRGMDLTFIRLFEVGYAVKDLKVFDAWAHDFRLDPKVLDEAGALKGRVPFFIDRITIPIKDTHGNVLGFTARRFRETESGPKYVNTRETPLFKKSQILFGVYESRKTIVKEKRALIVEGQIDAMRLIHEGFDYTLAGQGTAFGEQHVQQVAVMGVETVYITFDGDTAGRNATIKVGQLFMKRGIEVLVPLLEKGDDPDTLLLKKGKVVFQELLDKAIPYLDFLRKELVQGKDLTLPAVKSSAVKEIAAFVNDWQDPVMRHEGKRRIAEMFDVPVDFIRVDESAPALEVATISVPKERKESDVHQILEGDLIRWLVVAHEKARPIVERNLAQEALLHPEMRRLFSLLLEHQGDLMAVLATESSSDLQPLIDFILAKKIPIERAESLTIETVRKILERNWLAEREKIVKQMQEHAHNEALLEELVKKFDLLKQMRPTVI